MDALVERVERLERENRRLRSWVLIGLLGLAGGALLGQAPPSTPGSLDEMRASLEKLRTAALPGNTIQSAVITRKLVIVDEKGDARAVITTDADGPRLNMIDSEGHLRAHLGLSNGETYSGLTIGDSRGKTRASILVGAAGPTMALADEAGKTRAGLRVTDDASYLLFVDETGLARGQFGLLKRGPSLRLSDKNGARRAELSVRPTTQAQGPDGSSNEEASLALRDASGKLVARLPDAAAP